MSARDSQRFETSREPSPSRRARLGIGSPCHESLVVTFLSVGRRIFSLLAVLPILVIIVLLREAGGL